MTRRVGITLVAGVEGMALYIHDYRVAGPKPWGGGTVQHEWVADIDDIREALRRARGKKT